MNSEGSSPSQPPTKQMEQLTLKELFSLLHGPHVAFAYDTKCISKQDKVTHLYGKLESTRGFVVDYKVYEKKHETIVKVFLPPRGYNNDQWEDCYEGYILQGVTEQSFTHPSDSMELRRLYHSCCPSTQVQFHTKCSGSVHYGAVTKVFQLTDLNVFLSLLSDGCTLSSVLSIDVVNKFAETSIP